MRTVMRPKKGGAHAGDNRTPHIVIQPWHAAYHATCANARNASRGRRRRRPDRALNRLAEGVK
ncbi:hypothetical protein BGC_17420 [Burkholderia sp. 3C]